MKVLVTGGCGFIGSAVANRLVTEGHEVDIVDDLSAGDPSNLEVSFRTVLPTLLPGYISPQSDVLLITGDFADTAVLDRIRSHMYEVIFHLAAQPRVGYSVEHPVETNEVNLHKSLAIFKLAADSNTRVVFSSSSAVYGSVERLPTNEMQATAPESPYGLQKSMCEQYIALFAKLYGLDAVCLRYFNAYGPKAMGDSPYATAVAAWCHALKDNRPLRKDGDGEQSRDLVFIDDIVEANYLAAQSDKKFDGEVINICAGKAYTNNEILEMFEKYVGKLDITHAPSRDGDVRATLGDTRRARALLNFVAQTKFEEGLDKTLKWWELIDA